MVSRPHRPHDEFVSTLRRSASMAFERRRGVAEQVDVDDVVDVGTVGMPAVLDGAESSAVAHDAFRQQEAGRERAIVAGRPHDHRERPAVQPDLERLLHRGEIVRRTIRPAAARPTTVTGTDT